MMFQMLLRRRRAIEKKVTITPLLPWTLFIFIYPFVKERDPGNETVIEIKRIKRRPGSQKTGSLKNVKNVWKTSQNDERKQM